MPKTRTTKKSNQLNEKIPEDNLPVSNKEQSARVTTKVLGYFRFRRRCKYIATEVGVYNSDILVFCQNTKKVTEIEVKVSFSDFKNDFKKSYKRYNVTRNKHEMYADSKSRSQWKPHYFYFAAPQELAKKILEYLDEHKIKLGVLSVLDGCPLPYNREEYVIILRRCPPLHTNPIPDILLKNIIERCSSELVTRRQRLHKILQENQKEKVP